MKAGIIEINLQYTFVLSAYVAAFDNYVRLTSSLVEKVSDPSEDMDEVVGRWTIDFRNHDPGLMSRVQSG